MNRRDFLKRGVAVAVTAAVVPTAKLFPAADPVAVASPGVPIMTWARAHATEVMDFEVWQMAVLQRIAGNLGVSYNALIENVDSPRYSSYHSVLSSLPKTAGYFDPRRGA